jgi:rhodanese-related sulfurtransferase
VNYVNAEEAKKLIAVEEYAILDVRDKNQYDRAHIKSCYHVPIFIENQDNDFGKAFFLCACVCSCSLPIHCFLFILYALLKSN